MRGDYQEGGDLFSYVSLEKRVPAIHPIRKMRALIDEALEQLDTTFDEIYADKGRPSIPPERLIRASLLGTGVTHSANGHASESKNLLAGRRRSAVCARPSSEGWSVSERTFFA